MDKVIVFGIALLPGSGPVEVLDSLAPEQNVNDVASQVAARQPEKLIDFM